jgi:hypothetical protein
MVKVVELFFLPPLAIARLGGSDIPLECFHWVANTGIRDADRTTIEPAMTLAMSSDGSLTPYLPQAIRFRDGDKLRPVAPFFELWARAQADDGAITERPVTLDLLSQLGLDPTDLRFEISVANKKAQRRTQQASCGFIARVVVNGGDYERKPLLASSPHDADHVPLVRYDAPVPLGAFQMARPIRATLGGIDLSAIRVRFTPAKGEVYGPPTAIASIASPLPEGENFVWSREMQGRMHEIVKPKNRILNPDSAWSKYTGAAVGQTDPQPYDSYDGAKNGDELSWGVVDDTCDGVIEAHLVIDGTRYRAYARVTASPPDYSPDRRIFMSVADDLADRDLPPRDIADEEELEAAEDEIADLLIRVFETATQINLDAERHHMVGRQTGPSEPPHTDLRSMTAQDEPYADLASDVINETNAIADADIPRPVLQYSDLAETAHAPLTEIHALLEFLASRGDHVRRLVRPPFGRLREFAAEPGSEPNPRFRDPRVDRDTMQDMRMPPYMRDSDSTPLSLTWRQYHLLMDLVGRLTPPAAPAPESTAEAAAAPVVKRLATARIERRVAAALDALHAGRATRSTTP